MEPKTRIEIKKQGKRDGGPYSAKHVRRLEALLAETGKNLPVASGGGGRAASPKDGKHHKK